MKKTRLLMVCLSSCFSMFLIAESAFAASERWTVADTIVFAKNGRISWDVLWELKEKFNPAAKTELFRMLEDKSLSEYHSNIAYFLGAICDSGDVAALEKTITNYKDKLLQEEETYVVRNLIGCFYLMVHRNIAGASELLERMMYPQFWNSLNIKCIRNGKQVDLGSGFAFHAIYTYGATGDPEFENKARKLLDSISDPAMKRGLEIGINQAKDEYKNHFSKHRSFFDRHGGERQSDGRQGGGSQGVERRGGSKKAYIDAYEKGEVKGIRIDASEGDRVAQKAHAEFKKVVKWLAEGNFEVAVRRLADDGRPLLIENETTSSGIKMKLKEPELLSELENLKKVAREISAKAAENHAYRIKCFNFLDRKPAASSRAIDRDLEKNVDLVLIQFSCPELKIIKSAFPHLFKDSGVTIRSVDEHGNPIVTMVQAGGQFYWNPFGW